MAGAGGEGAAGEGQPDAVLLAPLTEDSFLHNLHVRYKQDIIYTYVGNALVSVNPGRALPLYSAELVRAYLARPPYTLPPHIYAIAATAYRWVRDRGEYQCIVMTGESGAGKTEAARVCLQCCVLAGGGAGAAAARLTAAGTLLEAFGNAATARNHNASRFGQLLDVEFDFRGEPVGGHITHWRLKLQRAWGAYRVLAGRAGGAGGAGGDPRRTPPPRARPHQADTDHFAFTKAAMVTLGFSAAQRGGVLRVLAFLLKLGNVSFEPEHHIDGSLGARLLHHGELEEACGLVGVCARALGAALQGAAPPPAPHVPESSTSISESDSEGSESEWEGGAAGWGAGGADWARARRDALLGALHARLFTWLVAHANSALQPPPESGNGGGGAALGIVDVYGLEALAHNGLERLLVNSAAERVQAAVRRAAHAAQDEYARERLQYVPVSLADPNGAADLLDQGPESILALVESVAGGAGGGAGALLARLQRRRHARLLVLPPDRFQVTHFGGPVVYSARGMAAKNRDAVCRRAAAQLAAAGEPVLRALFPPASSPRRGGGAGLCARGGGGAGLCARQRALLAALSRRLAAAPPRLVRCLRNDPMLRARRFDHALLLHQLRTQGIVEMALVRRAGWCEAMCARALLARYGLLRPAAPAVAAPAAATAAPDAAVRAARDLLRALPIPSAEFAFGRTKVFIRSPRTVWELEALRAARVCALVGAAQRAWRAHRARAAARRRAAAQRVIARAFRAYRETRAFPERLALRRRIEARRRVAALGGATGAGARQWAARVVWRAWCAHARRRYLTGLARALPPRPAPPRGAGPPCAGPPCAGPPCAWPPCAWPALLGRADALLRRLHHRWRCALYRRAFDQTARNRMREKVTASVLFRDRKVTYARSVAHPFVGDYVRLRASAAWRRGPGGGSDRYVVFADIVRKVGRAGARAGRCLCVVSTHALLLLDARSLRVKRRVPACSVYRLSLSPLRDDLLAVHVRACGGLESSTEELSQCSTRDAPDAGCLFGEARRHGDVLLRAVHVLELATKLFLVVQNAGGQPPHVHVATQFEVSLGGAAVTVCVHEGAGGAGGGAGGGGGGGARLVRRGSRLDVLL